MKTTYLLQTHLHGSWFIYGPHDALQFQAGQLIFGQGLQQINDLLGLFRQGEQRRVVAFLLQSAGSPDVQVKENFFYLTFGYRSSDIVTPALEPKTVLLANFTNVQARFFSRSFFQFTEILA